MKYFLITSERNNFDVTEYETLKEAKAAKAEFEDPEEGFEYINYCMIIKGEIIK